MEVWFRSCSFLNGWFVSSSRSASKPPAIDKSSCQRQHITQVHNCSHHLFLTHQTTENPWGESMTRHLTQVSHGDFVDGIPTSHFVEFSKSHDFALPKVWQLDPLKSYRAKPPKRKANLNLSSFFPSIFCWGVMWTTSSGVLFLV